MQTDCRERSGTLDLVEWLYIGILSIVAATAWAATLLAQLGSFSLPAVAALTAVVLLLAALPGRMMRRRPVQLTGILILGVLGLLAIVVAQPFEWVLGARDPGYYFHIGILAARYSGLTWDDPFARTIMPELWPIFYSYLAGANAYERFLGMPFLNPATGATGPFFFPLFSASMGLGYAIAGVGGALRAPSIYILLGCAGVYIAGRRFFSARVALIAAGLLAITPAEIWFGRFPMSESAMQCWFWGGLATLAIYLQGGAKRVGLLCGACWGLAALTHMEMLLAVPIIFAGLVLAAHLSRRPILPLVAFYLPLGVQALLYALTAGWGYTAYIAFGLSRVVAIILFATPPALLVIAAAPRLLPLLTKHEMLARRIAVGLVVAGAFAAIVLRYPSVEALSWYIAPWALLLALSGAVLLILTGNLGRVWFWLALAVPIIAQLFVNPGVSPDYHWAIRRWLPVAIPTLLLLASYALLTLMETIRFPRLLHVLRVALLAATLAYAVTADLPVLTNEEYPGVERQLGDLASRFPEKAVILLWPRENMEALALPLKVQYNRETIVVQQSGVPDRFWQQIDRWHAAGYRIFTGYRSDESFPFHSSQYQAVPAFTWTLHTRQLEYPTDHYPVKTLEIVLPVTFDELVPSGR